MPHVRVVFQQVQDTLWIGVVEVRVEEEVRPLAKGERGAVDGPPQLPAPLREHRLAEDLQGGLLVQPQALVHVVVAHDGHEREVGRDGLLEVGEAVLQHLRVDCGLGAVTLDEVAELQHELRVGLDVLPRRRREPLHEPAPLVVLALHAQGEYLCRLPRLRLVVRVVDADLRRVEVHVAQHEDGVLRVHGTRGHASGSGGKQRPRAQFQEVPAV